MAIFVQLPTQPCCQLHPFKCFHTSIHHIFPARALRSTSPLRTLLSSSTIHHPSIQTCLHLSGFRTLFLCCDFVVVVHLFCAPYIQWNNNHMRRRIKNHVHPALNLPLLVCWIFSHQQRCSYVRLTTTTTITTVSDS